MKIFRFYFVDALCAQEFYNYEAEVCKDCYVDLEPEICKKNCTVTTYVDPMWEPDLLMEEHRGVVRGLIKIEMIGRI